MVKPNFLISIPAAWLNNKNNLINLSDVGDFYSKLLSILEDMRIEAETTTVIKKLIKTDGIFISHHTYFKNNNVWNIKKGYINGYLYFDRCGYSGWAEMANSKKLFLKSQTVEYDVALNFFESFTNEYITNNKSKIAQSNEQFYIKAPYVFVAGQRPDDTVTKHARIDTIQLIKDVISAYKNTNYKVVVKIHPQEQEDNKYDFLKNLSNVIVTKASIHKIIPNCFCVYTVNSGVGFEALLHRKKVFTSGHCDYHWVTTPLKNKDEVLASAHQQDNKIDEEMVVKFVYYMLNFYFVNAYSEQNIRTKIELAINEYNK